MYLVRPGVALFACIVALCAYAQSPQPQSPPPAQEPQALPEVTKPQAGLETGWEIAPALQETSAHAARLLGALSRINAEAWVANGASETYVAQLQSSKEQARAITDGAKALARNPERLSALIELLIRIQSLDNMVGSLAEGTRKYQGRLADAQALVSLASENDANRDRLQQYTVSLARDREEEFKVMDQEAQRCRGIVTAPAKPARSGRKK
jgi:hypothetical protein